MAVYYDSRYVLNNKQKHPTSLIGYLKFRDNLLDSGICDQVANQILAGIQSVRNGEHADKLLIRRAV